MRRRLLTTLTMGMVFCLLGMWIGNAYAILTPEDFYPMGRKSHLLEYYTYSQGMLVSVTDQYGNVTYFKYGLREKQTDKNGDALLAFYYKDGGLYKMVDQYGQTTYVEEGRYTRIEDAEGNLLTTYDYDPQTGFLISTTRYELEEGKPVAVAKTEFENGLRVRDVGLIDDAGMGLTAGEVTTTWQYSGRTLISQTDEISHIVTYFIAGDTSLPLYIRNDETGKIIVTYDYEGSQLVASHDLENGTKTVMDFRGWADYMVDDTGYTIQDWKYKGTKRDSVDYYSYVSGPAGSDKWQVYKITYYDDQGKLARTEWVPAEWDFSGTISYKVKVDDKGVIHIYKDDEEVYIIAAEDGLDVNLVLIAIASLEEGDELLIDYDNGYVMKIYTTERTLIQCTRDVDYILQSVKVFTSDGETGSIAITDTVSINLSLLSGVDAGAYLIVNYNADGKVTDIDVEGGAKDILVCEYAGDILKNLTLQTTGIGTITIGSIFVDVESLKDVATGDTLEFAFHTTGDNEGKLDKVKEGATTLITCYYTGSKLSSMDLLTSGKGAILIGGARISVAWLDEVASGDTLNIIFDDVSGDIKNIKEGSTVLVSNIAYWAGGELNHLDIKMNYSAIIDVGGEDIYLSWLYDVADGDTLTFTFNAKSMITTIEEDDTELISCRYKADRVEELSIHLESDAITVTIGGEDIALGDLDRLSDGDTVTFGFNAKGELAYINEGAFTLAMFHRTVDSWVGIGMYDIEIAALDGVKIGDMIVFRYDGDNLEYVKKGAIDLITCKYKGDNLESIEIVSSGRGLIDLDDITIDVASLSGVVQGDFLVFNLDPAQTSHLEEIWENVDKDDAYYEPDDKKLVSCTYDGSDLKQMTILASGQGTLNIAEWGTIDVAALNGIGAGKTLTLDFDDDENLSTIKVDATTVLKCTYDSGDLIKIRLVAGGTGKIKLANWEGGIDITALYGVSAGDWVIFYIDDDKLQKVGEDVDEDEELGAGDVTLITYTWDGDELQKVEFKASGAGTIELINGVIIDVASLYQVASGDTLTFDYDEGRLETISEGADVLISYKYDEDKLISMTMKTSGSGKIEFPGGPQGGISLPSWVKAGDILTFTYDEDGKVEKIVDTTQDKTIYPEHETPEEMQVWVKAGNVDLLVDLWSLGFFSPEEALFVYDEHDNLLYVKDAVSFDILLECVYDGVELNYVNEYSNFLRTEYWNTKDASVDTDWVGKIDRVVMINSDGTVRADSGDKYYLFNEGYAHSKLGSAQSGSDGGKYWKDKGEILVKSYTYDSGGKLTDVRYYTWTGDDHSAGYHGRYCYRHDTYVGDKKTGTTWYNDPAPAGWEPELTGKVVKDAYGNFFLNVSGTYYLLTGRDEDDYNEDDLDYGGKSKQMNDISDWDTLVGKQITVQGYHLDGHAESGIYYNSIAAEVFEIIGPITIL